MTPYLIAAAVLVVTGAAAYRIGRSRGEVRAATAVRVVVRQRNDAEAEVARLRAHLAQMRGTRSVATDGAGTTSNETAGGAR